MSTVTPQPEDKENSKQTKVSKHINAASAHSFWLCGSCSAQGWEKAIFLPSADLTNYPGSLIHTYLSSGQTKSVNFTFPPMSKPVKLQRWRKSKAKGRCDQVKRTTKVATTFCNTGMPTRDQLGSDNLIYGHTFLPAHRKHAAIFSDSRLSPYFEYGGFHFYRQKTLYIMYYVYDLPLGL